MKKNLIYSLQVEAGGMMKHLQCQLHPELSDKVLGKTKTQNLFLRHSSQLQSAEYLLVIVALC